VDRFGLSRSCDAGFSGPGHEFKVSTEDPSAISRVDGHSCSLVDLLETGPAGAPVDARGLGEAAERRWRLEVALVGRGCASAVDRGGSGQVGPAGPAPR